MGATRAMGFLAVAGFASMSGCNSDGGLGKCQVPPQDRAPQAGDCSLVDWDATSVDGDTIQLSYYVNPGCTANLDRVEVDETEFAVTLTVVVGMNGDEGATCGTGVAQSDTSVMLKGPLGSRRLLGCRPVGSFVPANGYNDRQPPDPEFDCLPNA